MRLPCDVCAQVLKPFQILSEVVDAQGRVHGHYLCVVEALGPARALAAMQAKRLPMYDPATIQDGYLPKYAHYKDVEFDERGVPVTRDAALVVDDPTTQQEDQR